MVLRVFFVSTTGRRDIRKGQIHVFSVLSSWKYDYKAIDVAAPENENERNFVVDSGKKAEDGKIVLPQIFKEEECCGDYLDFLNAIEHEKLHLFLKQITQEQFDKTDQKEEIIANDEATKEMKIETTSSEQEWDVTERKEEAITTNENKEENK